MAKEILSAEYLRERLIYNSDTGEFFHRHSFGTRYHAGDRADTPGHAALTGYRLVNLLSQKFLAHRVAWLYLHCVSFLFWEKTEACRLVLGKRQNQKRI